MTESMTSLGYSSKTITERAFTKVPCEKRPHTASGFLTAHGGDPGRHSIADFKCSWRRD
jgi:hypothetical protein